MTELIAAIAGTILGWSLTFISGRFENKKQEKKELINKLYQNYKEFMEQFAILRTLIWQLHADYKLFAGTTQQMEMSGNIEDETDKKMTLVMIENQLLKSHNGKIDSRSKYSLAADMIRTKTDFFLFYIPDIDTIKAKAQFDELVNEFDKDIFAMENYYKNYENISSVKLQNIHLERYKLPLNIIKERMLFYLK